LNSLCGSLLAAGGTGLPKKKKLVYRNNQPRKKLSKSNGQYQGELGSAERPPIRFPQATVNLNGRVGLQKGTTAGAAYVGTRNWE